MIVNLEINQILRSSDLSNDKFCSFLLFKYKLTAHVVIAPRRIMPVTTQPMFIIKI